MMSLSSTLSLAGSLNTKAIKIPLRILLMPFNSATNCSNRSERDSKRGISFNCNPVKRKSKATAKTRSSRQGGKHISCSDHFTDCLFDGGNTSSLSMLSGSKRYGSVELFAS